MPKCILSLFFVGVATSAYADDAAINDLNKARAAHKKELSRLRVNLLAAIDKVIKQEDARGAGIDYLLKERRGFEANGVDPVLPKLVGLSREYLAAKNTADDELAKSYSKAITASIKAGKTKEALQLRDELSLLRPPPPPKIVEPVVESKEDLGRYLTNTHWAWNKGGILTLKPNGVVSHPGWDGSGFVMQWEAVDRRTFKMTITKGAGTAGTATGRIAVLQLSDKLDEFRGRDFDSTPLESSPRKK